MTGGCVCGSTRRPPSVVFRQFRRVQLRTAALLCCLFNSDSTASYFMLLHQQQFLLSLLQQESELEQELSQALLDSLNVEQQRDDNRKNLDALGGVEALGRIIGVNFETGLTANQITSLRERFGVNVFPETPLDSFFTLLIEALSDMVLLILIAAATVSLIIGAIT
eukprot:gene44412-54313_t